MVSCGDISTRLLPTVRRAVPGAARRRPRRSGAHTGSESAGSACCWFTLASRLASTSTIQPIVLSWPRAAARHEEEERLRQRRLRRHRPLREQPHALRAAAPRPGAAALEVHRLPRGVRLGRLLYERDGALKEYLSQQHPVRLRRGLGQAGGVSCAENGETLVALRVFNLQLPTTASTS